MRVTLVGPCASGKSVLARALQDRGYDARQCSQEHSYVPDMWRRIGKPDVQIYLDPGWRQFAGDARSVDILLQVLNDRLRVLVHIVILLTDRRYDPRRIQHTCYVFCNISSGRHQQ